MATTVNQDLARERKNATFNTDEMSSYLHGGDKMWARKRHIESLVFNDPAFNGPNYHFLERSELYSEGIRKVIHMVRRIRELGLQDPQDLSWFRTAVFPNENNPTQQHSGMFLATLMGQASKEQQEQWLDKALRYEVIGSYVQTEMGHGTFLRGLETTATYDEVTEEFELNSPTISSSKWWSGGVGKTCNVAVVMADLRIKGKSHGMAAFIVALRDIDTNRPLKGITVGDIGPKFGYGMADTGFLRMDHVRIPRTNMLMKNAQVLKDGTYIKAKHAKLGYGTMVGVRSTLVSRVAAFGLGQAAVIATRYSCVRHQSELKPGAPEPQVMDYQTQQYKIFPELAAAYAYMFTGRYMNNMYKESNAQIQKGDVGKLPELHALSSCLKSMSSYGAAAGMETCRLACGGHGYSQASGLPKIFVGAVVGVTYEGENTVLYLQAARYLVKMCASAKTGEKLASSISYLTNQSTPCRLDRTLDLDTLVVTFEHRARRLIQRVSESLARLSASGMAAHDAWNQSSVNLTKASQAHAQFFVVKVFVESVHRAPSTDVFMALTDLCKLFAAHLLIKHSGDFLEDGYMSAGQMAVITAAELELLAAIRPNAVALADAFDFHDRILESELGRYDGNVYENLYKWAVESPLNKDEVHPSFNKYMKPFREASKL